MIRKLQAKPRQDSGMSLVEMLITVAIIGIISAIAVVPISNVTKEAADKGRDRRNAQQLASIYIAAKTAGLPLAVSGDLKGTVDNIVDGGVVSEGIFAGSEFRVPNLSDDDRLRAMAYLEMIDDNLIYDPSP